MEIYTTCVKNKYESRLAFIVSVVSQSNLWVCMHDSGRPRGDVHGTDSRLGPRGEVPKDLFSQPRRQGLRHSRQDVLTLLCFLSQLCCWRLREMCIASDLLILPSRVMNEV